MGIFGKSKMKIFAGSQKIKKAYLGTEKIYSAGNVVTYHVDSDVYYTVEVENGANILNQTPSKDGYTFVGWRRDKLATGTVLTDAVMEDDPITLYAVFSKDITLTYYNATSKAATATDKQYYNNGNITNPKFTIEQLEAPSWESRGWATNSKADAAVAYETIREREFSSDTTVYALYQRTITLSYYSNGSAASQTGLRYWNSAGKYSNPSFTISNPTLPDATFKGWSASSGSASISYDSISGKEFSADTTIYAVFKYNDTTASITVPDINANFVENFNTARSASIDMAKYYALIVAVSGWCIAHNRGGYWSVGIQAGGDAIGLMHAENGWGEDDEPEQVSCSGDRILNFTSTSGTTTLNSYGNADSSGQGSLSLSNLRLLGRTIVG